MPKYLISYRRTDGAGQKPEWASFTAQSEASLEAKAIRERVDRRILLGIIDGWLLEQQTLANWRRNPMQYGSALADGIHDLMTKESAPAPVRMRYIIAKLRAAPKLIAAARASVSPSANSACTFGASCSRK